MKNTILIVLVSALVGFGLGSFLSKDGSVLSSISTSSTTTFNSAKLAEVGFSPATGSATSTSILNTDSTDRIVQDAFIYCDTVATSRTAYSGTGLAALLFTAATSSTAAPVTNSNANYAMYNIVSTSTPNFYVSSTTIGVASYGRVWESGSYMSFFSNATNTAACVVGVHYLAS